MAMSAFVQPALPLTPAVSRSVPVHHSFEKSAPLAKAILPSDHSSGIQCGGALGKTLPTTAIALALAAARRRHRLSSKRRVSLHSSSSEAAIDLTSVRERTLRVNLDDSFYGSFAEIGAGQEVSRWFLRAGAAAGTVARSVSAYDMQMSDRMYGTSKRYVTRERLIQMMDQEYRELNETLRTTKGPDCRFFAFASTIAAKAFNSDRECEGWLGCLYQSRPGEEPSMITLHVAMMDPTAELQGDALGILGSNLVYLCKDQLKAVDVVRDLMHSIAPGRLAINSVTFDGPAWPDVDPVLVGLWLAEYGLAPAVVFMPTEDGRHEISTPNEAFYKKPLCIQRGRFRLMSKTNEAIFNAGVKQLSETSTSGRDAMPVIDFMISPLGYSQKSWDTDIPPEVEADFVSRFKVCASLGLPILVSGMPSIWGLAQYTTRFTNQQVVIAVGGGAYSIERGMFSEAESKGLAGGLLEAFGKIFSKGVEVWAFPNIAPDGTVTPGTESKLQDEAAQSLFHHLVVSKKIKAIEEKYIDAEVLDPAKNAPYRTEVQQVFEMICKGDGAWEELLPDKVRDVILEINKKGKGLVSCDVETGAPPISPLEQFYINYKKS